MRRNQAKGARHLSRALRGMQVANYVEWRECGRGRRQSGWAAGRNILYQWSVYVVAWLRAILWPIIDIHVGHVIPLRLVCQI